MARNDMLQPRHPATADEAFAVPRRRFVPRTIGLFLAYVLAVLSPGLVRELPGLIERITTTTPPAVPPTTAYSPPTFPIVEPVRSGTGWVLDQPNSNGTGLLVGYDGGSLGAHRVAQTFRAPVNGASLRLLRPRFDALDGRVTVTVYALDATEPTSGRKLFEGLLEEPDEVVRFEPPIRLELGRQYSFVLRLAPPRDVFDAMVVRHLSGTDVYSGGNAWVDGGGWTPRLGDLSFRLEFDGV